MALAPHEFEFRRVTIDAHDVVLLCERGDIIRVMRNIGNGHNLRVQAFQITLVFDPNTGEPQEDGMDGYQPEQSFVPSTSYSTVNPSPGYPPYPPYSSSAPSAPSAPFDPNLIPSAPLAQSGIGNGSNPALPPYYGWRPCDEGGATASAPVFETEGPYAPAPPTLAASPSEPPPPSYEDAVKNNGEVFV